MQKKLQSKGFLWISCLSMVFPLTEENQENPRKVAGIDMLGFHGYQN